MTSRLTRYVPERPRQDAVAPGELTERELDVLRLLGVALTQREIARSLYVSANTVKTHTRNLYAKLGASTRVEAVERAHQLGLL